MRINASLASRAGLILFMVGCLVAQNLLLIGVGTGQLVNSGLVVANTLVITVVMGFVLTWAFLAPGRYEKWAWAILIALQANLLLFRVGDVELWDVYIRIPIVHAELRGYNMITMPMILVLVVGALKFNVMGGRLSHRGFLLYCLTQIIGQVGATTETLITHSYGVMLMQVAFLGMTILGAWRRARLARTDIDHQEAGDDDDTRQRSAQLPPPWTSGERRLDPAV